jgi:hypothetical protein
VVELAADDTSLEIDEISELPMKPSVLELELSPMSISLEKKISPVKVPPSIPAKP